MAGDLLITYLPNEILECILENDKLSYEDVLNFSSVCNKLRGTVQNNNKLWKHKFFQKWSKLKKAVNNHTSISWMQEFKKCILISKTIRRIVGEMSSKCYKKEEISASELRDFDDLTEEMDYGYLFVTNELMSIIFDGESGGNLTHKFYAEKALRFVRQEYLSRKWARLEKLPPKRQLLEDGAVLVAQWCQPLVDVSGVSEQLDEIASQVLVALRCVNDAHPLLRATLAQRATWRTANLEDNQWRPALSQQVLSSMSQVLFTDLGFHSNSEMYNVSDSSYINKVLETRQGVPIILNIIYAEVARRLGVKCDTVGFPAYFLLRWREQYSGEATPLLYFYIDVLSGGSYLTNRSCPRHTSETQCPMKGLSIPGATLLEVVEHLANTLEVDSRQQTNLNSRNIRLRSSLELVHLINPEDLNCILQLSKIYMRYNMDLTRLTYSIQHLQEVLSPITRGWAMHISLMLQDYERLQTFRADSSVNQQCNFKPKLRNPSVMFAVGLCLRHRRYRYRCVVYGWDNICSDSEEWKEQMMINNLPHMDQQPFYNVLVEDGSVRYAAQENLELLADPFWLEHVDVGRYFERFCGLYYEPNAEKQREYPEDTFVRIQLGT